MSVQRHQLQLASTHNDESYWKVESCRISALSFKSYKLVSEGDTLPLEISDKFEKTFENEYYKIAFDESRGAIKSLYDKQLGRELLSDKTYPLGGCHIRDLSRARRFR